jgi:hypothetical protein
MKILTIDIQVNRINMPILFFTYYFVLFLDILVFFTYNIIVSLRRASPVIGVSSLIFYVNLVIISCIILFGK